MKKIVVISIILFNAIFIGCNNGYAQNGSGGGWFDLYRFELSSIGWKQKIIEGGVIIPREWIGFGMGLANQYATYEKYSFFDRNIETTGNYGHWSFFTPTIYFIPLAKMKQHHASNRKSMNYFYTYLSYCPWSWVNLTVTDNIEEAVTSGFANAQTLDVGVAYSYNILHMLPLTVQAGYLNMRNSNIDADNYHFPSHTFGHFYVGFSLSYSLCFIDDLEANNKFALAPFIAEPIQARKYQEKMQRDWNYAQNTNSIVAYETFILNYPKEVYSDTSRARLAQLYEQRAWATALEINTIAMYNVYAKQFPDGKHSHEAKSILAAQELKDWQTATVLDALEGFEDYLKGYPTGTFVNLATEKRDSTLWGKALSMNSLTFYQEYLEKAPAGKHEAVARERIAEIDLKDWQTAKAKKTNQSYQEYLDRHPNGKFRFDALVNFYQPDNIIVGTVKEINFLANLTNTETSWMFYLVLNEFPERCLYFKPNDWEKYGLIKFQGQKELGLVRSSLDENIWKGIKVKVICSKITNKSTYPEKIYKDNAYYIELLDK